ncbi:hypothetical protein B1810_15375 [Panacagrimonas perspica]|nr:hypothetical protein B1810_15375 [Panacagrimonas perspica]
MLTRDIDLRDAVLDLVDNCVDGILRTNKDSQPDDADRPYEGFKAELTINPKVFVISDNCGGIPRETAEKYAFRLGRPKGLKDENLPTVGLYGIGMKRAIFKLGRSCSVTTSHGEGVYAVTISPRWMESDTDWDLPLADVPRKDLPKPLRDGTLGTVVSVTNLHAPIAQEFDAKHSLFLTGLANTIATHYAYIMHKGFSVSINGKEIVPKSLGVLVSDRSIPKDQRIEPFIYKTSSNGVEVELTVGLYREIPTDDEVQAEVEGKSTSGSRDTCGWTVICNDRVVLYSDKTGLTGWGLATVPAYHPQFIAISGLVRFRSMDVGKLPVTTTKRGIEASSELYLSVRDVMQEGLKLFTNFTNHWKSRGEERKAMMKQAKAIDPIKAVALLANSPKQWTAVRKGLGGSKYVPSLPKPAPKPETTKSIRFTRPIKEFEAVAEYLFDDKDSDPSEVGNECFERVLKRVKQ